MFTVEHSVEILYTRNHFWSQRREIRRPCGVLSPTRRKLDFPSFARDPARRRQTSTRGAEL